MDLSPTANPKKKLLYICTFFAVLYLIVEITGFRSSLSPDTVRTLFWQYQVWGIVLFCLAFSIGNLLYVPGWVFLVGAVFALGKEWGGLTTFAAAVSSSVISYYLIRAVGGNALRSLENKWADKIFAHLDARPIMSVAALRLIFQTLPALNYALALADIRFGHYLAGTLLGLPIPIFLYCYFFEVVFKHVLSGSS
jgi:uncharacterized membrane protein YdjX (TVP38/TMEM64 family)